MTHDLDLEIPAEESSDTNTANASTEPTETTGWTGTQDEASVNELATALAALARSQADYRNLLTRTERERTEMVAFLTEKILRSVLPSLDALERIIAGTPEADRGNPLYRGVESTASWLLKSLGNLGLASFSSIGEILDPNIHEAIMQSAGENGKIIAEVEKGYKIGDRVIRHAKVVVGNGEAV